MGSESGRADAATSGNVPLDDFVAVVPAGGVGSRLWPLSRSERPKFLLDVLGTGSTLIQDTYVRLAPLAAHVVVVTGQAHVQAVSEQLGDVDASDILGEPSPRDSMAAIALAAAVIEERHGPMVMGSFAADHVISRGEAFEVAVRTAVEVARGGDVTIIGIEPTGPSTAFGYVRAHKALPGREGVLRVEAFTEKPDEQIATAMLAEGGHFWNAGMFVVRTDVLLGHLARLRPDMHDRIRRIAAAWDTGDREAALDADWDRLTRIAIDHAIAEPVAAEGQLAIVPADLGWHDVGDFAALAELLEAGDDGVIKVGREAQVVTVDANGVMVVGGSTPVAVVGLDDIAVIETPEAILVLRRDAAQRVKAVSDLM